MMSNRSTFLAVALACGLIPVSAHRILAQSPNTNAQSQQDQEQDPLKRKRSDKEEFHAQEELKSELKGAYKTWLEQDVAYIIGRRTEGVQEPEQ